MDRRNCECSDASELRNYGSQASGSERSITPTEKDRTSAGGIITTLLQAGRYEIIARVVGPGGQTFEESLPFDVVDDAIELTRNVPDWQLMNQLAELNERAGGKVVPPDQFDSLIQLLRDKAKSVSVTLVESHHLGEGAVDSWI